MSVNRKPIGDPLLYKGHTIQPYHMGPDLICKVDGQELSSFYIDAKSAFNAGMKHVDHIEKEKNIKEK